MGRKFPSLPPCPFLFSHKERILSEKITSPSDNARPVPGQWLENWARLEWRGLRRGKRAKKMPAALIRGNFCCRRQRASARFDEDTRRPGQRASRTLSRIITGHRASSCLLTAHLAREGNCRANTSSRDDSSKLRKKCRVFLIGKRPRL